jgi:hypothetical protein
VEGFSEQDNEPSGSIKCLEILVKLNDFSAFQEGLSSVELVIIPRYAV